MKTLRKLVLAAAAAAACAYSALAAPVATGSAIQIDTSDDANGNAYHSLMDSSDNILYGQTPVFANPGSVDIKDPQTTDFGCLTDGKIPYMPVDGWSVKSDSRALLPNNGTLTWTWQTPENLGNVRFFTQWSNGRRCDVAIKGIEVLVGDNWTTLANSTFDFANNETKNTVLPYVGGEVPSRMATFADANGVLPLAIGATGLRITFGMQDENRDYGAFWEIEAARAPDTIPLQFSVKNTVNGGTDYVGFGEVAVDIMPYAQGYEEYQITVGDAEPDANGWRTYTAGSTPDDVITFTLPQTLDEDISFTCHLRGTGRADLSVTDTIKSAYGAQPTASVSGGISVLLANDYDGALVTAAQLIALSNSTDSYGGIVSVTAEDAVVYGNTNLTLTVTNLAGNSATCNVPVTATVAGGALPADYIKTMLHLGSDILKDSLTDGDGPDHEYLSDFGGDAHQLPHAGLAYSGLSTKQGATTQGTLVWTPMQDSDGLWLDNKDVIGNVVKYWHVYVYSPFERDITWRQRSDDNMYVYVNGELQSSNGYTSEFLSFDGHLSKGLNSITVRFREDGGGEYMQLGICQRGTSTFLSDLTYSLEPPFLVKDAVTGDIRKLTSDSVKVKYMPRLRGCTHYQIVQDDFFETSEPNSSGWLAYDPDATTDTVLPCSVSTEDPSVYYTLYLKREDGTVVKHSTASLSTGGRVGDVLAVGADASITEGGDGVLKFVESGSIIFKKPTTVDVLLVGGGGGGGNGGSYGGGGGGGGGVVYRQNITVPAGKYAVVVGTGGAEGAAGQNSSFRDLVAFGGGAGYAGVENPTETASGGCGGGMSGFINNTGTGGTGTEGQGYGGGYNLARMLVENNLVPDGYRAVNNSGQSLTAGGGGGGAGAPGGSGSIENPVNETDGRFRVDEYYPGAGGDGVACSITGSEVYYGGGGAGGHYGWYRGGFTSPGGKGGGGKSGFYSDQNYRANGEAGIDGLGGGGGGGGANNDLSNSSNGGHGGSGVVIIRFTPSYSNDSKVARGGNTVVKKDGWMIHTFTESGKFSIPNSVVGQVLLVGGGGGGGNGYGAGGGGGAGGMLVISEADIPAGNYEVTVGQGGQGGIRNRNAGGNGGDSIFASWRAVGGGGGAGMYAAANSGGSGGGAFFTAEQKNDFSGGIGVAGQGHDGGSNTYVDDNSKNFGAGGGGAGEAGYSATAQGPGKGGDGLMCDFSGEEKWYAGGGAGGTNANVGREDTVAQGGKGGGGDSGYWPTGVDPVDHYGPSDYLAVAGDAEPGTGGGGGGGANWGNGADHGRGGNGGSGIVIIRYRFRPAGFAVVVR